jgi:hypothetical protein
MLICIAGKVGGIAGITGRGVGRTAIGNAGERMVGGTATRIIGVMMIAEGMLILSRVQEGQAYV